MPCLPQRQKKLNGVVLIKKFQLYFYFNFSALYIVYLNKVSYRSTSLFVNKKCNNFRYSLEYEQNFHQFFLSKLYNSNLARNHWIIQKIIFDFYYTLEPTLYYTSRNVIIGMFSRLQMCNFLNSSCSKAKCQFGNLALNIVSLSCF